LGRWGGREWGSAGGAGHGRDDRDRGRRSSASWPANASRRELATAEDARAAAEAALAEARRAAARAEAAAAAARAEAGSLRAERAELLQRGEQERRRAARAERVRRALVRKPVAVAQLEEEQACAAE
jgi:hypothetical protein